MFLRFIIATAFLATALAFVGTPKIYRSGMSLPVALKQQSFRREPSIQDLADGINKFIPTVVLALASTVEPSMLLLLQQSYVKNPSIQDLADANFVPTLFLAFASMVEPSMLLLLNPSPSVMDAKKVIAAPPKFIKAAPLKAFTKRTTWENQDLSDSFAATFGVATSGEMRQRKAFYEKLDDVDEAEMLDSLDEYMDRAHWEKPLDAEKYVADATVAAFSPMDKVLDELKVNHDPKFFKPVPLSKMRHVPRAAHKKHVLHY